MLVCRIVLLSVLSSVTARYTEDTGPYSSGVVGRWEGKGRRVSRGAAVAMALRCRLWPRYQWPPRRRRSKPRPPPCRRCSGSHVRRRVWLPKRTEAPLAVRSSVPDPRRNQLPAAIPIPRSSSTLPTVEHVSLETLAHSLSTLYGLSSNHSAATLSLGADRTSRRGVAGVRTAAVLERSGWP